MKINQFRCGKKKRKEKKTRFTFSKKLHNFPPHFAILNYLLLLCNCNMVKYVKVQRLRALLGGRVRERSIRRNKKAKQSHVVFYISERARAEAVFPPKTEHQRGSLPSLHHGYGADGDLVRLNANRSGGKRKKKRGRRCCSALQDIFTSAERNAHPIVADAVSGAFSPLVPRVCEALSLCHRPSMCAE